MSFGLALLLIGASVASYSHKGTASNGKVLDKSSLVQASGKLDQAKVKESVGKLPLAFEPNQGQTDPQVKYIARAQGYTAFLTGNQTVLKVKGAADGVLAMTLQNVHAASRIAASDPQVGKSNYFLGNDRSKWLTNVPHYGAVSYQDVYAGIDVVYSGNQSNLEYDFVVKPGADPKQIHVAYQGSSRFALNAAGDLELQTAAGQTVAHKPVVYQTIHGKRTPVQAEYVLTAKNEVSFKLGAYDTRQPVVIDPTVTVLAALGGATSNDSANAVAANSTGVYLTGSSSAADATYPLTPITCFNSGTSTTVAAGCATLGAGVPVLNTSTPATFYSTAGTPGSTGGAFNGVSDAIVIKLSADGTTLLYSTYLGGSLADAGNGIAADGSGSAYVTGQTASVNFPVTNSSTLAPGAAQNVFVTKLSSTGSSLVYSTYYGGNGTDAGNAIAVDSSGNAYIGGVTSSTNILTVNGLNIAAGTSTTSASMAFTGTSYQLAGDGLIIKLDPNANVLFSTYLGSSSADTITGIAVDSSGNIYVAGTTAGAGATTAGKFPTTNSVGSAPTNKMLASAAGTTNGFVTKIAANFGSVSYSDTIGAGGESINGIAVSGTTAFVAGQNTAPAYQLTNAQLGGSTANPTVISGTVNNCTPAVTTTLTQVPCTNNLTAGNSQGFVLALPSAGSTASYLTYLMTPTATGTPSTLSGIAVDDGAQAYVTGNQYNGAVNDVYIARLNAPGAFLSAPTPGAASFVGKITSDPATFAGAGTKVGNGKGIAVSTVAPLRNAFVAGNTVATASLGAAPVGVGALANIAPVPYVLNGLASTTLANPKLPNAAGTPPGGGDILFGTFTFRDVVPSTGLVSFTANSNATVAGTNQTAAVTFTNVGGGTPTCALAVSGTAGGFFAALTPGTGVVQPGVVLTSGTTNSFTVNTGTQLSPAPGTPTLGTFTVTSATGCPFTETATVQVTLTSNATYTATATYGTLIGTGNISVVGSAGLPATVTPAGTPNATLTVSVSTTGTAIATSVTSNAPTGWPTTASCGNPISIGTSPITIPIAGTPQTTAVTINAACVVSATPGTYSGTITIASTAVPPIVPSITFPYTITVSPGITATALGNFAFGSNTAPSQAQTSSLTATAGGPFGYLATYAPTNTAGLLNLPTANVNLLAGASGSLTGTTTTSLVVQVTPTGLASGSFGGTITVSPTGTPTFAAVTIPVTALVGSGIVISLPSTSPLNISIPTGSAAGTVIPAAQLANSQIVVNNASSASVTITTSTGVASTFTGLTTSPLTLVSTAGTSCTAATNNSTCTYNVTLNTVGVTAGTYPGTITFTTSTPSGSSALTATLTVNLTVTAQPTLIVTTNTATSIPVTSVNLVATSNASQVCTAATPALATSTGEPQSPGVSTTAGTVANVTYTTSVAAGVNVFTATGANTIGATSNPITVCANPQLLGSTSGTFLGTVTVSSSIASTTFPVSLLLNATPGTIDLSNAGVFRAGTFVLDLDQNTYNYNPNTTKLRFFGLPGDQPVAGDWFGTGVVTMGIFRGGAWYFDLNNNGAFDANEGPFYFGLAGDTAIVGDWTGSGSTKIGVMRCPVAPAVGVCTWYLSTATQTPTTLVPGAQLYSAASTLVYNYGLPGDQPVANNWNGTAKVDQIGVFRCPAAGICSWIVDSAGTGASFTTYSFGLTGDIGVVGDWNDNAQRKRIGVFRGGLWILDVNGTNTFAPNDIGAGGTTGNFGLPGDKPVVGKWTMQ